MTDIMEMDSSVEIGNASEVYFHLVKTEKATKVIKGVARQVSVDDVAFVKRLTRNSCQFHSQNESIGHVQIRQYQLGSQSSSESLQ